MNRETTTVNVRIPESEVVRLLAEAISRRVSRDYDTLDDIRTNREVLQDHVRRAKVGDGDLVKYLQEMLDGDSHEIVRTYQISAP